MKVKFTSTPKLLNSAITIILFLLSLNITYAQHIPDREEAKAAGLKLLLTTNALTAYGNGSINQWALQNGFSFINKSDLMSIYRNYNEELIVSSLLLDGMNIEFASLSINESSAGAYIWFLDRMPINDSGWTKIRSGSNDVWFPTSETLTNTSRQSYVFIKKRDQNYFQVIELCHDGEKIVLTSGVHFK